MARYDLRDGFTAWRFMDWVGRVMADFQNEMEFVNPIAAQRFTALEESLLRLLTDLDDLWMSLGEGSVDATPSTQAADHTGNATNDAPYLLPPGWPLDYPRGQGDEEESGP